MCWLSVFSFLARRGRGRAAARIAGEGSRGGVEHGRGHQEGGARPERRRGEGWGTRGIASLEEVPPAGAAGSQAWADGRSKTNVAPKNVHVLFFLVVGDLQ